MVRQIDVTFYVSQLSHSGKKRYLNIQLDFVQFAVFMQNIGGFLGISAV
jgi:hypothetical protein